MTSFDEELGLSSPPVPAQTPELTAELARVVAEAEALSHRPRRRRNRRLALSGLVVAGTLGAGVAATAAGVLPWYDSAPARGVLTTSTGSSCTLAFGVKQVHDAAAPVDDRVRAEVTASAASYLEDLDVSAIDVAAATRAAGPRATRDTEAGPAQTVVEYEVQAVYRLVAQRLEAKLAQQGLPSSSVGLSLASTCDGGDQ